MFGKASVGSPDAKKLIIATIVLITLKANHIYIRSTPTGVLPFYPHPLQRKAYSLRISYFSENLLKIRQNLL